MQTRVHISLEVKDVEAATAFYERLFGVEVSSKKPDYANFRLDEPGLMLALNQKPGAQSQSGAVHHGIELLDDGALVDWRTRVGAAGLEMDIEEGVSCCYATADKFWVRDPDGHRWEFWVRTGDADVRERRLAGEAEAVDASSCCEPTCCS